MTTLSKEDIAKIHAEVNIYVNQRVTLLIGAISLVAVVLAWVTQRVNRSDISTLDMLYVGSSILLIFLCLICLLDISFQMSIASLVTYLRLRDASLYEKDHQKYLAYAEMRRRSNSSFVRVTSRGLTFVALGGIAALWPAVIATLVFKADEPSPMSLIHLVMIGIFGLTVFFLTPRYIHYRYRQIEAMWMEVLSMEKINQDAQE
jgi:hypothetical protein